MRDDASGQPGELTTEADDETPLSKREAEVAGMIKGRAVYGDSSLDPNNDDQADAEHAEPDEHF
jgi:hypothetical protein